MTSNKFQAVGQYIVGKITKATSKTASGIIISGTTETDRITVISTGDACATQFAAGTLLFIDWAKASRLDNDIVCVKYEDVVAVDNS